MGLEAWTHQWNVVFVLVLALAGLAVRATHEAFGGASQETSPAEGEPSGGEMEQSVYITWEDERHKSHPSGLARDPLSHKHDRL